MKNLTTLEKNNLDSITIYNIILDQIEYYSNLNQKIAYNFIEIIGFDKDKCKIHSYYIEFFKSYLKDNNKDYSIDSFSFYVTGKDGFDYISDETKKNDTNSLNVNKKNIFY